MCKLNVLSQYSQGINFQKLFPNSIDIQATLLTKSVTELERILTVAQILNFTDEDQTKIASSSMSLANKLNVPNTNQTKDEYLVPREITSPMLTQSFNSSSMSRLCMHEPSRQLSLTSMATSITSSPESNESNDQEKRKLVESLYPRIVEQMNIIINFLQNDRNDPLKAEIEKMLLQKSTSKLLELLEYSKQ